MTGWQHNRFDILLVRYMVMENEGNGLRRGGRALDTLGELWSRGCRFKRRNLGHFLPRSQLSNIYVRGVRVSLVS